ncbi:hypothetical protein AB0B13_39070 [Streptomyces sp. NPDC042898]|uniref:hypothetical protein n=1 Tax=Streptomyces sp. NPDC042898 TaxID=3154334 RepID=UPI0033FD5972
MRGVTESPRKATTSEEAGVQGGRPQVTLLLVLVIALNGVHATALHHRLTDLGHRSPTSGLLLRGGASAVASQINWWGAVVIGFLNSRR